MRSWILAGLHCSLCQRVKTAHLPPAQAKRAQHGTPTSTLALTQRTLTLHPPAHPPKLMHCRFPPALPTTAPAAAPAPRPRPASRGSARWVGVVGCVQHKPKLTHADSSSSSSPRHKRHTVRVAAPNPAALLLSPLRAAADLRGGRRVRRQQPAVRLRRAQRLRHHRRQQVQGGPGGIGRKGGQNGLGSCVFGSRGLLGMPRQAAGTCTHPRC